MKTTIEKWGDSQGVKLPKQLLESADISELDTLEMIAKPHSIVIKKVGDKSRKTIQERFQDFTGEYDEEFIDWGNPVGNELW